MEVAWGEFLESDGLRVVTSAAWQSLSSSQVSFPLEPILREMPGEKEEATLCHGAHERENRGSACQWVRI